MASIEFEVFQPKEKPETESSRHASWGWASSLVELHVLGQPCEPLSPAGPALSHIHTGRLLDIFTSPGLWLGHCSSLDSGQLWASGAPQSHCIVLPKSSAD